mmetsp:Transcript_42064/g.51003  ORF Transcript_42064/g.51003 Transcript_42064/m.51003 type:complete len:289 (-) Transcript_42064:195-1061(-)|eukprot:CAMPEP_0197847560 /NCGR_PEP_ID=MMETSP1438-20131217/6404_1 /TAXON_ID=1461541 /ORGANISM="Pterosperma sp., Strain CCMP1384" /LENGTH=288 /DNA_ID=CAMNT_0043459511 /DNA_START=150 /DNA_END=1016 /DNA_ORIENTATION=+
MAITQIFRSLLSNRATASVGSKVYLPATTVFARSTHSLVSEVERSQSLGENTNWIFLGPPGVGKGTYSKRLAKLVGVPHISTGDLVREEIKTGSELGTQMKEISSKGGLVPDSIILDILRKRLDAGKGTEPGFLLDGFPRTASQAESLAHIADIKLVVNFGMREDVMIEKCCGRRVCTKCGTAYNIADIYRAPENGKPEIIMPPLNPPASCADTMEQRPDDTEEIVQARLDIYKRECGPVEDFYRAKGLLMDFEISGGIPETLPRLLDAVYAEIRPDGDHTDSSSQVA